MTASGIARIAAASALNKRRASHQTGWTGGVPKMLEIFGQIDARAFLEHDRF